MAIDFEKIHKEFDGMMLDLCVECKGKCEKDELTMFIPGEIEFTAKKMNLSSKEFIEKFCNIIKFKGNEIYIIKAGVCPFLNKEYRCELEESNCKIIRCLLYPVLIGIKNNKIRIFVDPNCPMANRITEDFRNKAFKIYEEIKQDIPKWWLEFVSRYDECTYDYKKLEKLRNKKVISVKELEECIAV